MRKAAFFLKNELLNGVDCRNICEVNPGIGGSEYIILSMAYYLSIGDYGIDVTLFVQQNNLLPNGLNVVVVKNLREAIFQSDIRKIDTLAFRHDICWIEDETFIRSPQYVKLIPWCHNFVPPHILSFYAKNNFFVRIITVGKEQLELYIDHRAYGKSDYIFNGIDFAPYTALRENLPPFGHRDNVVTYIGSLTRSKGFHILAEAWLNVLKGCPNAQLYVIGSGKLYDRGVILGKYGIAEPSYESEFMKYLVKDGNILPSVHFLGILGSEKNEILKKTKVGVPNPTGYTETFGITAVEMQLMGCVVTTKRCPGYLDTVRNKEFLYDCPDQLSVYILKALHINDYDDADTYNWLKQKFDVRGITAQWSDLLVDKVPNSGWLHNDRFDYDNLDYEGKRIKVLLSKYKSIVPGLRWLPTVETFKKEVIERIERKIRLIKHIVYQ
jgi:glycosyltransferase involved in cell wall biosynthesis